MTHRIFHVWEVSGPLPCLQLATCDSQRDVWPQWPRGGVTQLTMSPSNKSWKKCWQGWPVITLFELRGAYPEKSWMCGLMQASWQPVWCWRMHAGFVWQMMPNINLAQLDATVKGLNLALQTVHLHTDSVCVYHWLTDGESQSNDQSCKWDTSSKKVDDPTAADPWIRPPSWCYFHCVGAKLGRWADLSTKEMARFDKA